MYTPHESNKTWLLKESLEDLHKAAHILSQGGIVALPTETVYGLAADACNDQALLNIFIAKGRPQNNPLILHVDTKEKAASLFMVDSVRHQRRFERLANAFWPGPLTIVMKKASHVSKVATAGLATVGVRIPQHDATLKVLALVKNPLAMPSANQSTRPSPTKKDHVLKTLFGRIDAIVEGGQCVVGIESTIIRIDEEKPKILRPGMISQAALEQVLQESIESSPHDGGERPIAPGTSYLHYAPKVSSIKVVTLEEASTMWQKDHMILARHSDYRHLEARLERRFSTGDQLLSDDVSLFAKELYDALYACESMPEKHLIIISPPIDGAWSAIADRLKRTEGSLSL